jgi:hypothetical protein
MARVGPTTRVRLRRLRRRETQSPQSRLLPSAAKTFVRVPDTAWLSGAMKTWCESVGGTVHSGGARVSSILGFLAPDNQLASGGRSTQPGGVG